MSEARRFRDRLQRKQVLITIFVGILLAVLFPVMILLSRSGASVDCVSDDPDKVAVVQDVKNRLNDVGLKNTRFMSSTSINEHISRLCNDEITADTLNTYANQIEQLNEIGHQYDQPVPATIWDVKPRDMQDNNDNEYQIVDTLVNSQLEYAQLLIRSYNRFYTFNQDRSNDTALDTALDLLLYTVEYYDRITDEDFDTMDTESAHEVGVAIVRTWQQIIGNTARINPLTDEPIFAYTPFAHLSVTNMWRHRTNSHYAIGRIWGVSGFDFHFVGDAKNVNQVEHLAISIVLQYADDTSLLVLNAYEIQDALSGGQTRVMATADQTINYTVATEFSPYFTGDYISTIEHLRCILSSAETAICD